MIQEGPSKITETRLDCVGCDYFHSVMVRSGREPLHSYHCKKVKENELLDMIAGTRYRYIGKSYRTPQWCPYLKQTG